MSHLGIIFFWAMFYQIKQSKKNKYMTEAYSI
jgi:hypothetical protein